MLVSAPAHAAAVTFCVNMGASCPAGGIPKATIQTAITDASGVGNTYTIRVGSGTYTDGPYVLPAQVSLKGNGAGTSATATVLSLPAGAQTYLTAGEGSTVSDVRVNMVLGNGATGVVANNGSIVDNVVAFGAGSTSSTGIVATGGATLRDATVNMTGSPTGTGVRSLGGNTLISQSTWNGGGSGYVLAAAADVTTDTVRRVTVNGEGVAVSVRRGVLNIDNSLLNLGGVGTVGVQALPDSGATATVNATNLTVVRGAAGARGVVADASGAGTRTATVNLTNSIVRGPTTSLVRDPGTAPSAATLTVKNSNYETQTAGVTDGGANLPAVDPLFIDAATGNYKLRATSPLIDKGVIVPTSGELDLSGNKRSVDGDRNGFPLPDIGAYELQDTTLPKTQFSAGPQGLTNNRQPVFQFKAADAVSYECSLDGGAFQKCTSPATTPPLADGPHTFTVRAIDDVFNVENPPATRAFTVDTIAPNATITKKPAKRFYKQKVKFKFAVSEPGATLQCNLDNTGWKACNKTWKFNTKVGKHKLLVRAVDAAGNLDPTPAKYGFKRLKR